MRRRHNTATTEIFCGAHVIQHTIEWGKKIAQCPMYKLTNSMNDTTVCMGVQPIPGK